MTFFKNYKSLYILIILVLSTFSISHADLKGDEIPVSIKEYNQQKPAVVYLQDKNLWLVLWEDDRKSNELTCGTGTDPCGTDIYGQFIKADETLCGNEILLAGYSYNQTSPTVTYNPDNQTVMLAWQDSRGSSSGGYIYFALMDVSALNVDDCSGYSMSSAFSLGFSPTGGENLLSRQKPYVKYDPVNKRFILVYVESRDENDLVAETCFGLSTASYYTGDNSYIGYAIIDNTLTVLSIDVIRNVGTVSSNRSRLISVSKSTFEEVYTFEYFTETDNPVVGVDTTTNEQIFIFEGKRHIVKLTCNCQDEDASGTCNTGDTITTTLTTEPDPEGGEKHIYGIWYSQISLDTVQHKFIDYSMTTASYNPSVAFDPISKRFLVVWENVPENNNKKIYGQLISSGSGTYSQNILISYQDADEDGNQDPNVENSKQTDPYVEFDPVNQRFFVAWQDGRNGTTSTENLDIYGQYVDSEGSLRGSNFIINSKPFNQRNPVVSFNSETQEYIAIWKDAREANNYTCGTGTQPCGSNIYGQRFTIGQPQLTLLDPDGKVLFPLSIDFGEVGIKNESSEYSFSIKNSGDKILSIDCITESGTTLMPEVYEFKNPPSEITACDGTTFDIIPGSSLNLTLIFHPDTAGSHNMKLQITSNATQQIEILVQGIGVIKGASWELQDEAGNSITTLNFGKVFINDKKDMKLRIANISTANSITISNYSISDNVNFYVLGLSTPLTINPGDFYEFTVSYIPTEINTHTATLTLEDNLGNTFTLNIVAEATGVKVLSDIGTVVDFVELSTIPYLDNKPVDFTPTKAVSFTVNTGSTSPQTANITIVLQSIPANLAVYKVNSSGNWIKISNFVVSGNSITYPVLDDGDLDLNSQTGIIEDPVVIGSEATATDTTNNETDLTPPPETTGSGGGCSLGSDTDYSFLGVILVLTIILMRVFNMRKTITVGALLIFAVMMNSCGTGPGSDVGNSVFVDTLSIDPNYIQSDIIDRKDIDGDGICDEYIIPAADTITVTLKSLPLQSGITASDVTITSYTVEYYPANTASPNITTRKYTTACTVQPETETTCSFVVAAQDLKEELAAAGLTGSYNLKLILEGSEVLYDKDIKIEVGAYIIFDQFIGDNDDQCTP
ncbi:choice-of-anchor D domain-containing protein [Persephonella sp.]